MRRPVWGWFLVVFFCAQAWGVPGTGLKPDSEHLWEGGVIPYYISKKLPKKVAANVRAAIKHWNDKTVILLVPVLDKDEPYLRFYNSKESLASYGVCKKKKKGIYSGAGECGGTVRLRKDSTYGNVLHEIGHAVGMRHEHCRIDRDKYITVRFNKIKKESRHNFDKIDDEDHQDYGKYDFDSIMNYSSWSFAKEDGDKSMVKKRGRRYFFAQRAKLSQGDIDTVAEMYKYHY